MHIYASTTYFGDGSSVNDALRSLYKLNIKKIELGSNHTQISEGVELRKDCRYIVHNYFPPQNKDFILNIASESEAIREKSIQFIKSTIVWCQKNRIRRYTIHPGFFAEAISQLGYGGKNRNFDLKFERVSSKSKKRENVLEKSSLIIRSLYRFSKGKTQLLIENQGSKTSRSVTLFDSIEELEKLKKAVGADLKFNFNIAHAYLSGINLNNKKILNFIFANSPLFEVSEIKGVYDSHLPLVQKKGIIGNLIYQNRQRFAKKDLILEYRNISASALRFSFDEFNRLYSL